MATFQSLPLELFVAIFEQLDALSLVSAAKTCRLWNQLAKRPLPTYSLMCYRYNIIDGPPSNRWSITKKLQLLEAYHARMTSLNWMKSYSFPIENGDIWELAGGVFAQSKAGNNQFVFRKPLSISADQPDVQRDTAWTINSDRQCRDFGIDPFQDLLILISLSPKLQFTTTEHVEIHIRTMSTGEPHPLAKQQIIPYKTPRFASTSFFVIQVLENILAVLFHYESINPHVPGPDLFLWDWRSGDVLFSLTSSPNNEIDCFAFLTAEHVLVAERSTQYHSCLNVYDITQPTNRSHVRRFLLPELKSGAQVVQFGCYCEPTPRPRASNSVPFYTSPDNKICVLTIRFLYEVAGVELLEHPHTLIFFTSLLLKDEYPGLNISEEEKLVDYPINVPWTAWGFQTRMMLSTLSRNVWNVRVHGTRVVLQVKGDVPNHYKIRVLDFNPHIHSVPEEMLNAQSSTTSRYVNPRQDDVINNSFIFEDTIYTTLPYLEVTTKKFFMADAVMIDHDHIYLVQTREKREIEVLAF